MQHDSKDLQQYREKAAELADLRDAVAECVEWRELSQAQEHLDRLKVCTAELERLRATLHPVDRIMATYNVTVINEHRVSFVLPKDCSRLGVLREASDAVKELPGCRIHKQEWQSWGEDKRFIKEGAIPERICIDGHVEGTVGKNKDEQESLLSDQGLVPASVADLAVAIMLHWVATQQPLTGWLPSRDYPFWVRAADGVLCWVGGYLMETRTVTEQDRKEYLAMSARVPTTSGSSTIFR